MEIVEDKKENSSFICYCCHKEENIYNYAILDSQYLIKSINHFIPITFAYWIEKITNCHNKILNLIKNEQWSQLFCTEHGPFDRKSESKLPCPSKVYHYFFPLTQEKTKDQDHGGTKNKRKFANVKHDEKNKTKKQKSETQFQEDKLDEPDHEHTEKQEGGEEEDEKKEGFMCNCNPPLPARLAFVKKPGENQGRQFYACIQYLHDPENRCNFFSWKDSNSD